MKKASLLPMLVVAFFAACTSTADNNNYNKANAANTSNANTPVNSNQGLKNENGGSGILESDEKEVVIKIVDDAAAPSKCKLLNPYPDSVTLSEVRRERILWRVVNECTASDADDIKVRIEGLRGHNGTPSTKRKPFGEGDDCDNKFLFNKVKKAKRTRFLSKDVRFECDAPATECKYKYTVKARLSNGTPLTDVDPEVVINRTP